MMVNHLVLGLEKMVDVYEAKPGFADAETVESTKRKLSHVRDTIHNHNYKKFESLTLTSSLPKKMKQISQ